MKRTYIKIVAGLTLLVVGCISYHFWTSALHEFALFARSEATPTRLQLQSGWPTLWSALRVSHIDLVDRLNANSVDAGQLVMHVLRRFWLGAYLSALAIALGSWLALKHTPDSRLASRVLCILRWCMVGLAVLATVRFAWLFSGGGMRILSP